ncbi:MAG: zinc ribbon domain-containing protein [Terrimicrobiaceae bacterium]
MQSGGASFIIRDMMELLDRFLALQDRDRKASELRAELARIPDEKKAREKQLAESAARLDLARTRMKEIEIEKKSLDVEISAKKALIDRYKTQQLQTRKNEEYSALSHEISAAEAAITAIEDKEIVLMEEAESLAPKIAEAEALHATERAKIDRALALLNEKAPSIQTRLDELDSQRAVAVEGLDEDLLDLYQRLFKSKGGLAIVPIEHGVCTGCHMKVTHQTALEAKAGTTVVHCSNCGRILYAGST